MRTSSPDCDASSWMFANVTLCPPATIVWADGVVERPIVSAAARTVIVFIAKLAVEMVTVLPVVWPVTLVHADGVVESWIVPPFV